MIKINLLGQPRPKARRRAVPLEATLQIVLLLSSVALAVIVVGVIWYTTARDVKAVETEIKDLKARKAELETLTQQLEAFAKQQEVLQRRIGVVTQLQQERRGGEELLERMATSVVRTESLWLTNLARRGNSLTIQGTAGSIRAVANFITEMRRSGYFGNIEIRESAQDLRNPVPAVFNFTLTADVAQPAGAGQAAAQSRPSGPG